MDKGILYGIQFFTVHDVNMLHAQAVTVCRQKRRGVGIFFADDHHLWMIGFKPIAVHGQLYHALETEIERYRIAALHLMKKSDIFRQQ